MWKNRIYYLVFLLAMIAFFVFYDGWFSWFALWISLLLPLFSLLLSLPFLKGGSIRLEGERFVYLGEKPKMNIVLTGRNRVMLSECKGELVCTDLVSLRAAVREIKLQAGTPLPVETGDLHAGCYQFRIQNCRIYDFLGLFSLKLQAPDALPVTVYPNPVIPDPVPDFSPVRAVRYVPKPGGGFSEVTDIRNYRPGDPMRSVHWKLSAKTDSILVKEPQERVLKNISVAVFASSDRAFLDRIFGEALWVSAELLKTGYRFFLCYLAGETVLSFPVETGDELCSAMVKMLSIAIPDSSDPYREYEISDSDLTFFVPQRRKEET